MEGSIRRNAPLSPQAQYPTRIAGMKKPPPIARRPQDAMLRFDRLLAAMAPKSESKRAPAARAAKPRGRKPRKPKG
jgi:hypothetical protein